ncbi:hypothetical protein [Undibacterium sp. Di24W]|uniref:hypothetical protein n=1 Tax=Undibacterium sp. Di24W TaxID=3413033 RepID=UPI003BF33BC2
MNIKTARRLAAASIILTPIVLMAVTAYRWRTGSCAGNVHGSVWILMLFAASLVMTKNPYSAIAACLAYLPVGYIFSTEPCTAPRSQGAGGLIYLLIPLFVGFILTGTFIGGWILRLVFKISLSAPSPPSSGEAND